MRRYFCHLYHYFHLLLPQWTVECLEQQVHHVLCILPLVAHFLSKICNQTPNPVFLLIQTEEFIPAIIIPFNSYNYRYLLNSYILIISACLLSFFML